jgi:periplasmic divalent cation tolerance protein
VQQCFLVTTTTASARAASAIGRAVVKERLAACVQVSGPLSSTYRWQGRVRTAREWLVTVKTTRPALAPLMKRLAELHRYDTPEIVALPIVAGSRRYIEWLRAGVTRPSARQADRCR